MESQTYQKKAPGQSLTTTIVKDWKSPKFKVKFCNIVHAYYFPSQPEKPKYSVTVVVDANEDREFMDKVLQIEKNEKAPTQFKDEVRKEKDQALATGNALLKFTVRKETPIYKVVKGKAEQVRLTEELPMDAEIEVIFDLIRYHNVTKNSPGVMCKATAIYWLNPDMPIPVKKQTKKDEETPF